MAAMVMTDRETITKTLAQLFVEYEFTDKQYKKGLSAASKKLQRIGSVMTLAMTKPLTDEVKQRCPHCGSYVPGHRRNLAGRVDPGWLKSEYVDKQRTAESIGLDLGVSGRAIGRLLRRFDIPIRPYGAKLRGRKLSDQHRANISAGMSKGI